MNPRVISLLPGIADPLIRGRSPLVRSHSQLVGITDPMLRGPSRLVRITVLLLAGSIVGVSCRKEETPEPPVVETLEVTHVGTDEFTVHGAILETGDRGLSQHGFCWSATGLPSIAEDSCNRLGAIMKAGEFSSIIGGLEHKTTYYVRAYAINEAGVAYGKEIPVITEGLASVPGVVTLSVIGITGQ